MTRGRCAAIVLAIASLWTMFGTATTPAHACGYEDPVCDVLVYVLDRACVKFDVCS